MKNDLNVHLKRHRWNESPGRELLDERLQTQGFCNEARPAVSFQEFAHYAGAILGACPKPPPVFPALQTDGPRYRSFTIPQTNVPSGIDAQGVK